MSNSGGLAVLMGVLTALVVMGIFMMSWIMPVFDTDTAIAKATDWCEQKNGRADDLRPDYPLLYCYFTVTQNTCTQTDTMVTHYQEGIDKVIVGNGITQIHANGDNIILHEEVSLDEDYVGKTIIYDKKKPIFEQEITQKMPEKLYDQYEREISHRGWVYDEHAFTVVDIDEFAYDITSKDSSCKQFEHEIIILKEIRS
jgi:hypothetical protein